MLTPMLIFKRNGVDLLLRTFLSLCAHRGVTFGAQCDATTNGLAMRNTAVFDTLYRTDVDTHVDFKTPMMLIRC